MAVQPLPLRRARRWILRDEIAPETKRNAGRFTITSNASEGCYGGWELTYPAPQSAYARFRVKAHWQELARGADCVHVAAVWDGHGGRFDWEPIPPVSAHRDYVVYEGLVRVNPKAKRLLVRMAMAWSSSGQLTFYDAELKPARAPRPRKWRLGAAGRNLPPGERSIAANTNLYLGLCREAAEQEVDLLCLPEIMLQWGMPCGPETVAEMAVNVPGPELEPFQQFAAENDMVLCFSVLERNRELVHNTALLIDGSGDIVGRYRKVHLASPGEVWWGATPGDDFPVYRVNGAAIGMNICMDSSAVESARVPARRGAEIVCLPIMGDHRATTSWRGEPHNFDVDRWCAIHRVRAMDNQVFMVVSRNVGYGSGIFAPTGDVLALSGGPSLVWADADLSDLPRTYQGGTFRGVCWWERREPVYTSLSGGLALAPREGEGPSS